MGLEYAAANKSHVNLLQRLRISVFSMNMPSFAVDKCISVNEKTRRIMNIKGKSLSEMKSMEIEFRSCKSGRQKSAQKKL